MRKFLVSSLVNAVALWVATLILPGLTLDSGSLGELRFGSTTATLLGVALAFILVGVVMALVNSFVRPIVKLLSLPVTILTLGLFRIIINAAMLYLAAWITGILPVTLHIDTFFTAILAALFISVITMIVDGLLGRSRSSRS